MNVSIVSEKFILIVKHVAEIMNISPVTLLKVKPLTLLFLKNKKSLSFVDFETSALFVD